jgi:hypothetical protein
MVNHVELYKKAFVPFSFLFDIGLIVPSRDGTNITFLTSYIYSANNLVDIFHDFNSHLLPIDLSCDFLSGQNCVALATL